MQLLLMRAAWYAKIRGEIVVDIEVGGSVSHEQRGAKVELGVASDHLVVYFDPNNPDAALDTIDRAVQLHQFAKQRKSGELPPRKVLSYSAPKAE